MEAVSYGVEKPPVAYLRWRLHCLVPRPHSVSLCPSTDPLLLPACLRLPRCRRKLGRKLCRIHGRIAHADSGDVRVCNMGLELSSLS